MRESDKDYKFKGGFYVPPKPVIINNPCHEITIKEDQKCLLGEDVNAVGNLMTAATAYLERKLFAEESDTRQREARRVRAQNRICIAIKNSIKSGGDMIMIEMEDEFEKYQTEVDAIMKPFKDKGYLIEARRNEYDMEVYFFVSYSMPHYEFKEKIRTPFPRQI